MPGRLRKPGYSQERRCIATLYVALPPSWDDPMDVTLSFGFHAPPWLVITGVLALIGLARTVIASLRQSRNNSPLEQRSKAVAYGVCVGSAVPETFRLEATLNGDR
jgi:hypothetical protein